MIKSALAAVLATFLAFLSVFAQPAFANLNDNAEFVAGAFTGYGLMPMVCGGSSITPVFVTNFTSVPQTGSITINPELTYEAEVFTSAADAQDSPYGQCTSRGEVEGKTDAFTADFTVQPGQTSLFYLGMGGTDYNLAGTSHNIAIGGLPNGASNPKWYDFYLTLTADLGFDKLTLSYKDTGGAGSNNGQNGFNVVEVTGTANADGSYTYQSTQNTISPYSSTNAGGDIVWGANEPMGLAWLP